MSAERHSHSNRVLNAQMSLASRSTLPHAFVACCSRLAPNLIQIKGHSLGQFDRLHYLSKLIRDGTQTMGREREGLALL